ncbi:MAG TPA: hypothetical protein PLG47_04790 [Candidatus Dojkabacteria bacterium]|nr:hypothetical protein [Candidatus Dojkabacteria bacterium]
MNLIPAIREIRNQIRDIKKRHQEELSPHEESLESLLKINTACENCFGSGKIFKRSCAEDEGVEVICPMCNGTGKIKDERIKAQ